ncbi:MAG: ribonucleoprotein [Desulfurococcales archaeon ex4484_58]|nr:MAG: ribonucleoprotein [Desulfurococcales archaeon ex4484_58]
MSIVDASRRLTAELTGLIDRKVKIILADGRTYEGILIGFDHPTLNVLLENAIDNNGVKYPKVIIKGERISEILATEIPLFDPEEFKEYIIREMKLPEHLVKVIPEARAVIVQGRYRVSEKGVEGTGPMAETLYEFFKRYIEERKKVLQG